MQISPIYVTPNEHLPCKNIEINAMSKKLLFGNIKFFSQKWRENRKASLLEKISREKNRVVADIRSDIRYPVSFAGYPARKS